MSTSFFSTVFTATWLSSDGAKEGLVFPRIIDFDIILFFLIYSNYDLLFNLNVLEINSVLFLTIVVTFRLKLAILFCFAASFSCLIVL